MSETPAPYIVGPLAGPHLSGLTGYNVQARYLDAFVKAPFPEATRFAAWPSHTERSREPGAKAAVDECRRIIAPRLMRPPVGVVRDGRRCLHLWGALQVSVPADGRRLEARWAEGGVDSAPLVNASLMRPVSQRQWPAAFGLLIPSVFRSRGLGLVAEMPIGRWANACLSLTFRPCIDFRALRRSLLAFLDLDRLTLSVANRVFPNQWVQGADFNWVGRNHRALALVAIERPRLLPFLSILPRDRDLASHEPIALVEEMFVAAGMERAAFRHLETWGSEAFDAAAARVECADYRALVAEIANALHRLGVREKPPELFMEIVGVELEELGGRRRRPLLGGCLPEWYLRALYQECLRDDAVDRLIDDGELVRSRNWLRKVQPRPDANQRRAGWTWIAARSAGEEFENQEAEPLPEAWKVDFEDFTDGLYRVTAIRDAQSLREEGSMMKNCIATYHAACADGQVVVFSIRHAESGDRIACMSAIKRFDSQGHACWTLEQLAGRRNTRVEALKPLAEGVVRRLRP